MSLCHYRKILLWNITVCYLYANYSDSFSLHVVSYSWISQIHPFWHICFLLSCYNWLLSNYNSSQNHVNVLPGTLPKKTYYNLCTLILYMLATLKGMLFLLLSLFTVGCPKVIQQWMPNCHVNAPRRRLRETDLNIILHSI